MSYAIGWCIGVLLVTLYYGFYEGDWELSVFLNVSVLTALLWLMGELK